MKFRINDNCTDYLNITEVIGILILIFIVFTAILLVPAQAAGEDIPVEEWNRTFSIDGKNTYATSVLQTNDGGYIMVGYVNSPFINDMKSMVIKTDKNGNIIWEKTFEEIEDENLVTSIKQTTDGGFVLAGTTRSLDFTGKALLIKIDGEGNQQWVRRYGRIGSNYDYAADVQQTSDGGFVLAGGTSVNYWSHALLIRTDADGKEEWNKTFGNIGTSYDFMSIQIDSDGNYVMAGSMSSYINNVFNALMVKTDPYGNLLWEKTYGKTDAYYSANSMDITSDGGYVLTGSVESKIDTKVLLIKTDVEGNQQWIKTFAEPGVHIKISSAQQTIDNGYILAGDAFAIDTRLRKALLLKTDEDGNKQWNITYGSADRNYGANAVQQTSDSGYIIGGNSFPLGEYNPSAFLVKFSGTAAPSAITVCPEGCDYTSIQEAVDAADPGSMIQVYSGTYSENVNVNKQLVLQGLESGSGLPVVDGGEYGDVITLSGNGIILEGFIVTNSGDDHAGIRVLSHDNTISGNMIMGNNYGINMDSSKNNMVAKNSIFSNEIGILLADSQGTSIDENTVNNNEKGILLRSSTGISIGNNHVNNNEIGVGMEDSSYNSVKYNYASNNEVGLNLMNSNNNLITQNQANNNEINVNILDSSRNTISDNYCQYNEVGISLSGSSDNSIKNNYLSVNEIGIRIASSTGNAISHNHLSDSEAGIQLNGSTANMLMENEIFDNEMGIYLISSHFNSLFHNNLGNNDNNAMDDSPDNSWDLGYPSGGNFWDDYSGLDQYSGPGQDQPGSDGIGDTPYIIPGAGAQDRYPLMEPWKGADLTPPYVTFTSPADLETGVRIDTNITAAFSEPVNIATLNNTTVKVNAGTRIESEFIGLNGSWNSSNFPGFVLPEEITVIRYVESPMTINVDDLRYNTRPVFRDYQLYAEEGIPVGNSGNYSLLSWQGELYVVVERSTGRWVLTNKVLEQESTDIRTLSIGESWDLGEGYSIKYREMDVSGNKVWMFFNNSSGLISDRVIWNRSEYVVKTVIDGHNVPFFVTFISSINSTAVELKYTWLINPEKVMMIRNGGLIGDFRAITSHDALALINDEDIPIDWRYPTYLFNDLYLEVEDPDSFRIRLVSGTTIPVEGKISYDGSTMTFDPLSDLMHGTDYVSIITTGVEDLSGNHLVEDYTWEFRTEQ